MQKLFVLSVKVLLVLFLLSLVLVVWGFKTNYVDRPAIITSSGVGKINAAPNLVKLTVNFSNTASDSASALSGNAAIAQTLTKVLTGAGVDKTAILVSNASLTPIKSGTNTFSYRASNDVNVSLTDVNKYPTVIKALFDNNFQNIGSVEFTSKNAADLEKQAINLAVKDAQAKAANIAAAAGKRVGKMVSIATDQTGSAGVSLGTASDRNVSVPSKIEIVRNASIVYTLR